MIEREQIFDPQEVERVRKQLPEAERALGIERDRIERAPNGFYILKISSPEGRAYRRIDWDVVRMIGGGILRMYEILRDVDRQSEEKQLNKLDI